ncbi:MAG: hypothetical protein AAGM22_17660 [Acidobacteriota bacterium]
MSTPDDLQSLLDRLGTSLDETFEARLRDALAERSQAWLVEQLTRHVLRERHLAEAPHQKLARQGRLTEPVAARRQRLQRIERLQLDDAKLRHLLAGYGALDRAALEAEGYLVSPPHLGKQALDSSHRSARGDALLQDAHDLFYALLFGTPAQNVRLPRMRRDFLTVTLPSSKSALLERFMLAVTETPAAGTWLDPEGVSDDVGARNTLLQVEFGDSADGLISDGLIAVIRRINALEVNEEILYARIEQLEKSTLVS